MPKTPNLQQLEQAEQDAMARVTEARAAAEQVRLRAERARAQAEHQHDEKVLVEWSADRADLQAAATAARERLYAAVLADPVWSAYAELLLVQHRITTRSLEASGASGRLHGKTWAPGAPLAPPDYATLAAFVEQHASARGWDEANAREQARADAGQAAAGKEAGR